MVINSVYLFLLPELDIYNVGLSGKKEGTYKLAQNSVKALELELRIKVHNFGHMIHKILDIGLCAPRL